MLRIGLLEAGILAIVFLFLCVVAPRHAFSAEMQQVQVAQHAAIPLRQLQLDPPRTVWQVPSWQAAMLTPVRQRFRDRQRVMLHDAPPGQPDLLFGARRGSLQTYFERRW